MKRLMKIGLAILAIIIFPICFILLTVYALIKSGAVYLLIWASIIAGVVLHIAALWLILLFIASLAILELRDHLIDFLTDTAGLLLEPYIEYFYEGGTKCN